MSERHELEDISAKIAAGIALVTPLAAGALIFSGERRDAAKLILVGLIVAAACLAVSFGAFISQTADVGDAKN